ncbi:MAG: hypothetical protein ACRD1G_04800, partial [Acidimicrobiales bacterium]
MALVVTLGGTASASGPPIIALRLTAPLVGMASSPSGNGYWISAGDGGVFAFGDAQFYGSMGGHPLNQPIVGIAAAPGGGYWEVASDGGIFAFNAPFYGSMGGHPLNKPIVSMTGDQLSGGYRMVASDGGIFSFHSGFYGSMGGQPLAGAIIGAAAAGASDGYWMVGSDGGVFSYAAPFEGAIHNLAPPPSASKGLAIAAIAQSQVGQGNNYGPGQWCAYFVSW